MTNKNNNQPVSSLQNEDFNVSPVLKSTKIVPLNIRYDVVPQQPPIKVKEETARVIRRYSFDDNGGGYLGL